MPKPTKRARVTSSSSKKAKTKKTAKTKADEAAYLEMLVKTGQAVPVGTGKVPAGATHVLVPDDQGKVKAVRRRFSVT